MVTCYYCDQPLGQSRKRGITGEGVRTFHKPCFSRFIKEQSFVVHPMSGFYQLLEIWHDFIQDSAKIAYEVELSTDIATARFLNNGEPDEYYCERA